MGTLLYFAGALINLGFFVYLLVIVFQTDHWGHGVAIILVPCYALIYIIMHWDECSTPFWGMLLGTLMHFGGGQMIVGGG
tara:strand:- start:406 stop:645 length:240 start_codon:yes stop_codon:yes gene_type:complete